MTLFFSILFTLRESGCSYEQQIPHLPRCQGFAVGDYGFTLDVLDLGHPRLSLNQGRTGAWPQSSTELPLFKGFLNAGW